MEKLDLLIRDGEVWTPGGFVEADVAVHQGKVVALGKPPVCPSPQIRSSMPKGKKSFRVWLIRTRIIEIRVSRIKRI